MIEVIISDVHGVEQPEFGRRFHDHAPREMLFDGAPCEFVRFKAPGVAVYRRLPDQRAPMAATLIAPERDAGGAGLVGALVAEIVRAADRVSVGTLDLRNAKLAATSVDLLVAWERLRRDGLQRALEAAPRPLSSATLTDALTALRQQGFDWRVGGSRKHGLQGKRRPPTAKPTASRSARVTTRSTE
jgi:hypothetical protein